MIVRKQLIQFWITNEVFIPVQFGFLKWKSCLSQLLSSFHDWARERNKGLTTDVIFLDLSKTFDSVPHERLLTKIRSYGIQGSDFCLGLDAFSQIDTSALFCGDITHLGLPFCLYLKEPCWDPFYFSVILMIFQEILCQTQNSLHANDMKVYRILRDGY